MKPLWRIMRRAPLGGLERTDGEPSGEHGTGKSRGMLVPPEAELEVQRPSRPNVSLTS